MVPSDREVLGHGGKRRFGHFACHAALAEFLDKFSFMDLDASNRIDEYAPRAQTRKMGAAQHVPRSLIGRGIEADHATAREKLLQGRHLLAVHFSSALLRTERS